MNTPVTSGATPQAAEAPSGRDLTGLDAAVVGAGLMGRVLAVDLVRAGATVTLYDRDGRDGRGSCGIVAAGMLAPWAELEKDGLPIWTLGMRSLERWPGLVDAVGGCERVLLRTDGSLLVAHARDVSELERLRETLGRKLPGHEALGWIDGRRIAALEPELRGRFSRGLYFPEEGQVGCEGWYEATAAWLGGHARVVWHAETEVTACEPGRVVLADGGSDVRAHSVVFDTRGLGAREALTTLRGVRGELVVLDAPTVTLTRPVRLMHPRYALYCVPRPGGRYLIGATSVESEDRGPATVQSLLELLSAAYTLHPGFAEARVVELRTQCRPALPDHLPQVDSPAPGLVRVNGLYRHGWLLAPALSEQALAALGGG